MLKELFLFAGPYQGFFFFGREGVHSLFVDLVQYFVETLLRYIAHSPIGVIAAGSGQFFLNDGNIGMFLFYRVEYMGSLVGKTIKAGAPVFTFFPLQHVEEAGKAAAYQGGEVGVRVIAAGEKMCADM